MRVVKQTDRYVILDDVLPPEQFELLLEYAARGDYARNPRWIKPWDLGDTTAMRRAAWCSTWQCPA